MLLAMSDASIIVGSRVYLKIAIAGDPGCVIAFDRQGKAVVEWYDLDLGHPTHHDLDMLILDESFRVSQLGFDFDEVAA